MGVVCTRRTLADEYIVIKILSSTKIHGTIYQLSTGGSVASWKHFFATGHFPRKVYIGLAPVHDLNLEDGYVNIGAVIEHPTEDLLEPGKEYASTHETFTRRPQIGLSAGREEYGFSQILYTRID